MKTEAVLTGRCVAGSGLRHIVKPDEAMAQLQRLGVFQYIGIYQQPSVSNGAGFLCFFSSMVITKVGRCK